MATSGGFHVFFQEISEYDDYVCIFESFVFWNFVSGINLMASRSVVLRMIFFAFFATNEAATLKNVSDS